MFTIELKSGVAERIVWSRPDSVSPAICSICFGALPAVLVPFRLWKPDGTAAAFCDPCANASFDVRPTVKGPSK